MYLYIYTFYSKTIKKANGKIVQTDSILKTRPKRAEYEGNPKNYCIKTNPRKKILRQRKCKKRNNLKSTVKEKSTVKAINLTDKNENLKKATYAEIL